MCGLQRFPSADVMHRLGNRIQLSPWYIPYGGLRCRGGAGVWHVLTPAVPAACGIPATRLQLREQPRAVSVDLMEEQYLPGGAKHPRRWVLEWVLRCRICPASLP